MKTFVFRMRFILFSSLLFSSLLFSSLLFSSCEKENPASFEINNDAILTHEDAILKKKLHEASLIMVELINKPEIYKEICQLASEKHDFNEVSFKSLASSDEVKSNEGSFVFSSLKQSLQEKIANEKSSDPIEDLMQYLIDNDCYLYSPYPLEWYPEDKQEFTIAAHPIDNDEEGIGYFNGEEVIVNEEYAIENPVLLILPGYTAAFAPGGGGTGPAPGGGGTGVGADPIYEVKVHKVWCDTKPGLFEGDVEMNFFRGTPHSATSGSWQNQIQYKHERKYIKKAEKDPDSPEAWKTVNVLFDSDWYPQKEQQVIVCFDYDWTSRVKKIKGSVKWKDINVSVEFELDEQEYKGFLFGKLEWDRDYFYNTQNNPSPNDEMLDGLVVRSLGSVKFTCESRTIQ